MAPSSAPYLLLLLLSLLSLATPDDKAEKAALLRLKDAVGINADKYPWNQSTSLCSFRGSFRGVNCTSGTVVELRLPGARLRGAIPTGIFGNLTSLQVLDLSNNSLSGSLPSDLASCTHLQELHLENNHLNSTILTGIFGSLTSLQVLDLSHNSLSGSLPSDLSDCTHLQELQLQSNDFSGPIPESLNKLKNLSVLLLDHNSFYGELPNLELGNLKQFNVSYNLLNGSVPAGLSGKPASAFLGTSLCGGPLPSCSDREVEGKAALLKLKQEVGVGTNHLPWNDSEPLCSWYGVDCDNGTVVGLRLPGAHLRGAIPTGIFGNLTSLQVLSLGNNNLSDPLPPDLDKCTQLQDLHLEKNLLSGDFPAAILSLTSLRNLSLAENNLSGTIPANLANLKNLIVLLLNNNSFSGELPADLQLPNLKQFNVSFNLLNGSVPAGLSGMPANAFLGMSLCGRPLSSCPGKKNNKKLPTGAIVAIAVGSTMLLIIVALLVRFLCRRIRRKPGVSTEGKKLLPPPPLQADGGEWKTLVFLDNRTVESPETFELASLLRAPAEELGKGTFGTTYKAEINNVGTVVATKRLTAAQAIGPEEFRASMEAMGSLEHANVVGLEAYHYSSELKLLIYKYFPTGSLSSLLHGNKGAGRMPLIWPTRLNIALTAARGIDYIHSKGSGSCHGNIKSSNILLTPSYDAVVSDHSLQRLTTHFPGARASGYRAPEIGDLQKADVYSFGVLLLETLTGKEPGRPPWNSGADLLKWVLAIPREEWSDKVFDTELVKFQSVHDEMEELLQLAIDCCRQPPDNRPTMLGVVRRIEEIQAECAEPADDEDPGNASPIA